MKNFVNTYTNRLLKTYRPILCIRFSASSSKKKEKEVNDFGPPASNPNYKLSDEPQNLPPPFPVNEKRPNIMVAPVAVCKSRDHLLEMLEDTLAAGGEGLVIRKPGSLYEVGRSNNLLKVKPIYLEKVHLIKLEEIRQLRGSQKFCHASAENKAGRKFALYQRVSQIKFPTITRDSVVTIGFSGLHVTGIPKFPIVLQVHDEARWENVHSYFIDQGSPYRRNVKCESCGNPFKFGQPRVQTKGGNWIFKELGKEPAYQIFSFCLNLECVNAGTYNMTTKGVQFAPFENSIALKNAELDSDPDVGLLRNQGISVVIANDKTILTEEWYTLKSNSELVADAE